MTVMSATGFQGVKRLRAIQPVLLMMHSDEFDTPAHRNVWHCGILL